MAVAINSCAGFSIGRAVPLCRLSRRSPGPRSGFNIRMSTITGVESKEARDMLLPSPSRSASKEGLEYKINDEIDCEKVRLLLPILTDPDADAADDVLGPVINDLKLSDGIVNTADALQIASRLNLDLVLINERGIPPVCKIINVGKYKYQQEKRKKLQEKKQVHQVIKEFKLSCNINQHDIDIRIKAAKEHLEAGDKVHDQTNTEI